VSDLGDPQQVWDTIIETWAQVGGPAGAEREADGGGANVQRRTFAVRYRTDINSTHRILWPTTTDIWDVEDASDLEGRQRMTTITAVKRG
jgi:head-tail adaptor